MVYAHDTSAAKKHAQAQALLERLWSEGSGCLSVQVLQEFFVTVTKKVPKPLTIEDAADRVRELCPWQVFAPRSDDVLAAITLQQRANLSFGDAMIVEAAHQLGCATLWTEDLSDHQLLQGVRVRNPFS